MMKNALTTRWFTDVWRSTYEFSDYFVIKPSIFFYKVQHAGQGLRDTGYVSLGDLLNTFKACMHIVFHMHLLKTINEEGGNHNEPKKCHKNREKNEAFKLYTGFLTQDSILLTGLTRVFFNHEYPVSGPPV